MATKDGLPRVARNDGAESDPQPVEPVPISEPEGGWPADEFTGVGGSYVRDPLTGVRSPAGK